MSYFSYQNVGTTNRATRGVILEGVSGNLLFAYEIPDVRTALTNSTNKARHWEWVASLLEELLLFLCNIFCSMIAPPWGTGALQQKLVAVTVTDRVIAGTPRLAIVFKGKK
jgi:hypothetical protein